MGYSVHYGNEKRASDMKYAEDAAMLVAALGNGATVRFGRRILWTEGEEEQGAGESYDYAAETIRARERVLARDGRLARGAEALDG